MNEYVIYSIFAAIILFFLFREVMCWYYKINESISLQKETNMLLRKMLGEDISQSATTSDQSEVAKWMKENPGKNINDFYSKK